MKEKIFVLFLLCLTAACFPKSAWTDKQKEDYLKICVSNNKAQYGDKIDDYCACMLAKLQEKSPNPLNLPDIPFDTLSVMKSNCSE